MPFTAIINIHKKKFLAGIMYILNHIELQGHFRSTRNVGFILSTKWRFVLQWMLSIRQLHGQKFY